MKAEPFQGRVAAVTVSEEWVLRFEDLGNPALIKEHTAELQLPFTLKPQ